MATDKYQGRKGNHQVMITMGLFSRKNKKDDLGWNKEFSAEQINKIITETRESLQRSGMEVKDEKTMTLMFKNLREDELPAARELADMIKEGKLYQEDSRDKLEEIYEQLKDGKTTIENMDKYAKQMASLAHYADEQLKQDERVFKKALPDDYKDIKYVTKKEETIIEACKDIHKTLQDAQGSMDDLATKTSIVIEGKKTYTKDEQDKMLIEAKHLRRFLKQLNEELVQVHRIHKHIMSASARLYSSFEELTKAAEEMHEKAA